LRAAEKEKDYSKTDKNHRILQVCNILALISVTNAEYYKLVNKKCVFLFHFVLKK